MLDQSACRSTFSAGPPPGPEILRPGRCSASAEISRSGVGDKGGEGEESSRFSSCLRGGRNGSSSQRQFVRGLCLAVAVGVISWVESLRETGERVGGEQLRRPPSQSSSARRFASDVLSLWEVGPAFGTRIPRTATLWVLRIWVRGRNVPGINFVKELCE